jgi:hypothetical protein
MKAQPKTFEIVERINALQAASPHYIDSAEITPNARAWRVIKRDIDAMFAVDACAAWELIGAWKALAGDFAGTEDAFEKSAAIGDSGTNHMNRMVNRLNLGKFSAAQDVFKVVGDPERGNFLMVILDGFRTGAIEQAASFIERAKEMRIEWNKNLTGEVEVANRILREAGISDERIARHLDVAGQVLTRHRIRPHVSPRVTSADGFFSGVTYALAVPVSADEAFDMNIELALEEGEAGIDKDVAFDVVFEPMQA